MQQGVESYDEHPQPNGTYPNVDQNADRMSNTQKKRILTILFGRLLKMHKQVMVIATIVHAIIIFVACMHIFTLGTVDSEANSCYLTWPLTHLYYAFINYLFSWFYCYNACEITNPKGHNILNISKKFLKVMLLFSFTPIPLKYLAAYFCRNWTLSWHAVVFQTAHIFLECAFCYIYFSWFEKKYAGFRIFYRESAFN